MKPKKLKRNEPTLLEQLSEPLRDIVSDLKTNVADELKKVRERNSEKYLELATKLLPLIATINPKPDDFSGCKNFHEIGMKLLKSVGVSEFDMNEAMIADALAANDAFIDRLQQIRDEAQGQLQ